MTDHKFTDDDVIKALEICAKSKCWGDCKDMGCPAATKQGCYFHLRTDEDYEGVIQDEQLKDALALIYNQKAKIEALQMDNAQLQSDIVNANMNLDHAQAEIERLQAVHADMTESLRLAAEANKDMQAEIETLKGSCDRWKQIATDFDKASRETEKEIERLTTLAELGNMRANDYRAMRNKAKNARAEAIKEFAERLKKKMYPYNGLDKKTYAINARAVEKAIEDLVKEMTEEHNESQNT